MRSGQQIYYYGLQAGCLLLLCGVLFAAASFWEKEHGAQSIHPDDTTRCTLGDIAGPCRSIDVIERIKADHDRYVSDRSILWIEKDYLSREAALDLQERIDKGIGDVERTLGLKFPVDVYKQRLIEFFIHGGGGPSHALSASWPRRFLHPVILLTEVKEKRAPYIREIFHVVAWDWHTLWLREGLAIVLNDRLGGDGAYPNFGASLDDLARDFDRTEFLTAKATFELLGQNGVPEFPDKAIRRTFYVFSGSFVAHLEREVGLPMLMQVNSDPDTAAALLRRTGKTVARWKAEWQYGLGS